MTLCARGGPGRLRGRKAIGGPKGYIMSLGCLFTPWESPSRPFGDESAELQACSAFGPDPVGWRLWPVFEWDLKPVY